MRETSPRYRATTGFRIGTVHVAGTQRAVYQIAELDCLSADADHGRHRSIGPRVSKSRKVLFRRKPLRLEAAHLARRADMQVCNCNGVIKAALGACVAAGNRTTKAVMDATSAGKGCGSCKNLVAEFVLWFCGGEVEEDPSIHYYVPGVPLTKPQLIAAVHEQNLKSVSAVWALAGGTEDAASKPALASLLASIWNDEYEDERDARFINNRVHGNIQKDGTFSVIPEMPGGVCTPDELMRIAGIAVKYKVPLVKLTGGQRIDLVGIPKDQLPAVWSDLGMPAGFAWGKWYRTCKSCVGTDYCRFGLGDSMGLAYKIERRFWGIDSPAKLKLATAGCPRNCSEALVKDVGFVAIGWEIYIGGAGGSHVRKGDLMCTVTAKLHSARCLPRISRQ